ncbi:cytochrome P450 [Fusarium albosuccineum]|uniref:Cytochrome P450 n=1 Tax=Fusarium albosuccineum TaxID=1237068 RepID=A0A8H4L274_9HYPO|nr:cytochrome P450 [Fusarium albosuccineum]
MVLIPIVVAALSLLVTYLYTTLRFKRFKQYAHLPQLPPSLLWGHMRVYDEFMKRGNKDRHPDFVFGDMHETLGRPPVMLADMRPVSMPVALITSHDIAEQVAKSSNLYPWGPPKSPTLTDILHLIGPKSILSAEGEEWKTLRKRFSPGFAPNQLVTLLPCILDKTEAFIQHLDNYALSGNEFSLLRILVNLTMDIMSVVIMDEEIGAQETREPQQSELVRVLRTLLSTYSGLHNLPWWLTPRLQTKRRRLANRMDQLFQDVARRKFEESQKHGSDNKTRSILSLSFQGTETLTPEVLSYTSDQLRTFFFAGHDTTSILLAWTFYELSRTPRVHKSVCAELDGLFGPDTDPATVRSKLYSTGKDLIHRMIYVAAVIKEVLRMYPPAATARYSEPGTGFTVRTKTGQEYCLDGTVMYNCHTVLHRDPEVYGASANEFVPERWLDDTSTWECPPSAWRPFERGPRNCIGQELANLEARVIIAMVARQYDFVKVGLGELELDDNGRHVLNEKDQYEVKSELYSVSSASTLFVLPDKSRASF